VKHQIALCAAVVILGLVPSSSLLAQPAYPPSYPGTYPGSYPGSPDGLPPYEIVAIVRSTGFEPLSRPVRQGPAYVVRAVDPAGRVMQVFVNARMGRIVRVVPVMRDGAISPPYPIPPGRIVADGNSPNSRIAGFPEGTDNIIPPEERNPAQSGLPGSLPGSVPAPARAAPKAGPPPLPRPRPKTALVAEPAPSAPPAPGASANPAAGAPANPPLVELDE
jgi:hypothetical protein